MAAERFYFDVLYPFQDRILAVLRGIETGFYLTGGTAASRGYLQHRFSDDLDFFVNDDKRFDLWVDRVIEAISGSQAGRLRVLQRDERYVRLELEEPTSMKLEFVNDVPAHVGEIHLHPILGRLDSAENILANKLTALAGRSEPKDLADVWGFSCRHGLPLAAALEAAHSKAAGLFPADLARALLSATKDDWTLIRWIEAPPAEKFLEEVGKLGESLLLQR
jgi:Nucleotidyl transferase AbiEii toxin, Type IV TA system